VALYQHFAESSSIELFHASASSISENKLVPVTAITEALCYEGFLGLDKAENKLLPWTTFDVAFCRTDKPRPDKFHHYLQTHDRDTTFVNHPTGVETAGTWDFYKRVVDKHLPEHIFTRDQKVIAEFLSKHDIVVAKQSGSYGGREVSKISRTKTGYSCDNIIRGLQEYPSLENLLDDLLARDSNDFQFVRYLKNIDAGDKRVLVVDGEIYGSYIRKSSSATWVHNISAGGTAENSTIGEREIAIIKKTAPEYSRLGVFTLGYDFLMDDDGSWVLSEINAGNIGGYNRLEELGVNGVLERLTKWIIELPKH
jgi:glutathione synthase/RimK-type ligase-like ATP-grasp enzyme